MRLSTGDHDRDAVGATYVYPVVSRRPGGVSIGINLNPNNACNWRCVYCQVPGLTFGKGPPVDRDVLERELRALLDDVVHGDFLERAVPADARRINDLAFSGNGEPTSSPDFEAAVARVLAVRSDYPALAPTKSVLITNGSLAHKPAVQAGLRRLREANGEVWFKLDSATDAGMQRMNDSSLGSAHQERNLRAVAALVPTWLQTMVLAREGEPPSDEERQAYLALVERLVADGVPIRGVLLYGLARPSHQPEAPTLSALEPAWLEAFADEIRARGLPVRVTP